MIFKAELIFFLNYFLPFTVFAEISGPSLFKEMKSINPAVVYARKESVLSLAASKDQIKKAQSLGEDFSNTQVDVEVNMNRFYGFYGGKGGSYTSELFVDLSSGNKKTNLENDSSKSEFENQLDFSLFIFSLGINQWFGISLGQLNISFEQNNKGTVGSYSYSIKNKIETDAKLIRLGFRNQFFGLNFGSYIETFFTDSMMYSDTGEDITRKSKDYRAALSFGTSGPNHLFELSYEKDVLRSSSADNLDPHRISISLETGISGIVIGYTGRAYFDGFGEIENLMYANLIYAGNAQTRLQHIFNFSLGRSKGHSFGGSLSFSKSNESESNLTEPGSKDKFETKSEEKGISIKYSYTF